MALELMYITNNPKIALIAEKAGVDRVWVDLEVLGKEERQKGMNTVKSNHSIEDIKTIKPLLTNAKMQVRINPWNINSINEIESVISAGADIIMLPMWKSVEEVDNFIQAVGGRVKTILLLETKEAEYCLDDVLQLNGIDEIHIGLNDLHLSYGLKFMFELLANGTVERICKKIKKAGIPYGFGGVSHLGDGLIPAEMILLEHYRLKSKLVILSRGFCDISGNDYIKIEKEFIRNLSQFRQYENDIDSQEKRMFEENRKELINKVEKVVDEKTKIEMIKRINREYNDSFYLLDSKKFEENFIELKKEFSSIYSKFNIAYSYKTNYIPKICKIVNQLNGYAEVVSEMEMELALKIGVAYDNIIWNGPIKNKLVFQQFLLNGGTINVDSKVEIEWIKEIIYTNPNVKLNIGIRCNFDVGDGVVSRFGFDVDTLEFLEVTNYVNHCKNIRFVGLQCHFAKRQIEYWPDRVKGMIKVIDKMNLKPERIDVGGGLFGYMDSSLKQQFDCKIPTYRDYANIAAKLFAERFENGDYKPELVIEPGTALVGDCMSFVASVKTIKEVRGKNIATILGSQKNINMSGIKPPLQVIHLGNNIKFYDNIDIVGFTCIEGDVIYKDYKGNLAVDDLIKINNCGSYSVVMKPPFILPNFAIFDISRGNLELIKRKESFDDVFNTYIF